MGMRHGMSVLFSFTLFVSAFLLFWVQLMVAKMVLPLLGGSPAVWNTCLFFFQASLLLGYGYSHLTTMWWDVRRQAYTHIGLLLVPIAFLPISTASGVPLATNPILWLLTLLLISVGIPFFVVATSAPLLQKWFANTAHPASHDPYFLYTASNLGSMLGVLSYPILIEPNLSLTHQSWLWTMGYGLLVLLTLACAVCLWRSPSEAGAEEAAEEAQTALPVIPSSFHPPPPTGQQQAQWVLLSFLPSSLLLGVTTYLTTDLAAVPLLWAIPLAIYLLTFILTFARTLVLPHNTLVTLLPLVLTPLIVLSLLKVMQPVWVLLALHLVGFFITACVFHGELAKSRPDAQHLTIFYFWISLGGVLGGLFNAIAAPLLFPSVLEYPLIMGFSLLLLQERGVRETPQSLWSLQKTLPLSIGLLLGSLLVGFQISSNNPIGIISAFVLLLVIRYGFALHPIRFGCGLVLILLLSQFYIPSMGIVLDTERSFFGVNRVLGDRRGGYHSLLHGTTLHGKQSLDPQRRREPLTYFHRTGPIGQVFQSLHAAHRDLSQIAVMGLGIGTLAAYAEPEQQWIFYEIDSSVEKLARDTRYFTFLQDSLAPFSVVLGDGRLKLGSGSNAYNLIVMDAFSSDAIPVHLITREAIQLYFSRLKEQGLLVINISNRYINLEPVLGALASNLGLSTLRQMEDVSPSEKAIGKSASHWVLFARHQSDFGGLVNDSRWQSIPEMPAQLWTDDFSNIFRVLRAFSV